MMKTKTHKMLDLAIQILQAASEEDAPQCCNQASSPSGRVPMRGYVVRYASEQNALHYDAIHTVKNGSRMVLLVSSRGTIFGSHIAAQDAIRSTLEYQRLYSYDWTKDRGEYVIEKVYA